MLNSVVGIYQTFIQPCLYSRITHPKKFFVLYLLTVQQASAEPWSYIGKASFDCLFFLHLLAVQQASAEPWSLTQLV